MKKNSIQFVGEVDFKEISQKLIKGSREIDRMRKEIDDLISMILGLIQKNFENVVFEKIEISSEKCRWEILRMEEGLEVKCYLKQMVGHFLELKYSFYEKKLASVDVKEIHEQLPFFVEGVASEFPGMKLIWRFLIEAAD